MRKIVVAPDKFKECLPAVAVADRIEAGLRRALGDVAIDKVPMADGGDGTVEALVAATRGRKVAVRVTGPLGEEVEAEFGLLGDGTTAVIEMAAASGLALVPREKRNPLITTTRGTGELIRAALDRGVKKVICGIGGSATNDGGVGMAAALGAKFLDSEGHSVQGGGGCLARIARIELDGLHPGAKEVEFLVACDVDNPLTGPRGAAQVYGPQKGATPEMVALLDAGLAHLADVVETQLHKSVRHLPGAGAAGGLGAGFVAFLGGKLRRGVELVIEAVQLRSRLAGADLAITGEGRMDSQSVRGKTAIGVAETASALGVPVIAIVGSLGEGHAEALRHGISASFSILDAPMGLEEAIRRAPELLERTAEQVGRVLSICRG